MQDYDKFAFVLRSALEKNKTKLGKGIKYNYEPLWAIRAVVREETDYSQLSEEDFYSQEERAYYGEKRPRGVSYAYSADSGRYSCSFFKTKGGIANALGLPKAGWKFAIGMLIDSYGGIKHKMTKSHIHLFRYEKVVPAFKLVDYEELENK